MGAIASTIGGTPCAVAAATCVVWGRVLTSIPRAMAIDGVTAVGAVLSTVVKLAMVVMGAVIVGVGRIAVQSQGLLLEVEVGLDRGGMFFCIATIVSIRTVLRLHGHTIHLWQER